VSGWDARMWANVILTAVGVLAGLALLLWPPRAGESWWRWRRLFGAAFIVVVLVTLPHNPGPTRGGLISNGIVWLGVGLWSLFAGVWSVNGPDLPAGEVLRRNSKPAACFFLYGGAIIALGLTIPR